MPTVYIVNKGGHNFEEAKRYGHLEYLSEGAASRYAINKIYRDFAMHLRSSTPDDFILLTGLTSMSVVACSCFARMHGRLNLLLFKNDRYVCRRVMLDELLGKGGNVEDQISELDITKEA
jgi:hypothetical protein